MSALEILTEDGDTLADHARAAAAWTTLAAVAKDEADARRNGPVADRVRAAAVATGADGFTGRFDGVKVILTAPEPKPRVSDPDEFAEWWGSDGDGIVEYRETVEVIDPDGLLAAVIQFDEDNVDESWEYDIRACLEHVAKPYVAGDALDRLQADGRIKITAHGAYDTETGGMVPGVTVSTAAQQVRVLPDADAKAEFAGQLRAALSNGGE